jgi:hypothetical protein
VRLVPCLLVLLAACEARLGAGPDEDMGLGPDASIARNPDAAPAPSPDATTAIADNACGVASDQGDMGMLAGSAGSQTQSSTTTQRVSWVQSVTPGTATQATPDFVEIELWDGYGAFTGTAAHTGTFTISGAETDYDTCGTCVLMFANVDANNTPAKMLLATSGTVTVTSVGTATGQTTQATVTNASFVEITLVQNTDYQTVTTSSCPSPIKNAQLRGTL